MTLCPFSSMGIVMGTLLLPANDVCAPVRKTRIGDHTKSIRKLSILWHKKLLKSIRDSNPSHLFPKNNKVWAGSTCCVALVTWKGGKCNWLFLVKTATNSPSCGWQNIIALLIQMQQMASRNLEVPGSRRKRPAIGSMWHPNESAKTRFVK